MKKLFLFLAIFVISMNGFSQDIKYIYAEIVGTGKLFSNKVTVEVDFGQSTKFFSDNRLVGQDGKPIVFNSMVDAMNFMGNQGWEFAQAYVVTISNQNVYHWIMKKDITLLSDEEKAAMLEGLKTKSQFKK